MRSAPRSTSHWDNCPRGVVGGREAHDRQFLTHRLICGRLTCIAIEALPPEWWITRSNRY